MLNYPHISVLLLPGFIKFITICFHSRSYPQELTEADRRALEMYMPQQKTKQRSLADMIFDSMDRGEAVVNAGGSVSGMADAAATGGEAGEQSERKWGALHPKVIAASQKVS